ncbi:hypothetical protein TD95_000961 [Thielaviopsis punctulata]|uniref:Deacetylase sirtuin-type domain-containing protein n=1 Tax=Thielaviopsis punctulata TaxID=72032 RepID=A0A0F4ZF68_9PEZI|nr:hypothetical protein TD95_000961 [Thielaviopsis punctulata]
MAPRNGLSLEAEEFEGFSDSPGHEHSEHCHHSVADTADDSHANSSVASVHGSDPDSQAAADADAKADGLDASANGVWEDDDEDSDAFEGLDIEEIIDNYLMYLDSDHETPDSPAEDQPSVPPEEAAAIRQLLHKVGPRKFFEQLIEDGSHEPEYVIAALGYQIPPLVLALTGDLYMRAITSLLSGAMRREMSHRPKLMNVNTVQDAVNLIRKSSNIVVVTGAGISTSLGIPDFRSKGTGLYSQLEAQGYSDPTDVFDIEIFREDPSLFYSVAKDILPSTHRYTPTHGFIAELDRRNKLLTNYTQNIDNLESFAGISADRLIQCHGSFKTATCFTCGLRVPGDAVFDHIKAGRIPPCPRCTASDPSAKRKRPTSPAAHATKRTKRRSGSASPSSPAAAAAPLAASIPSPKVPARYRPAATDDDDDGSNGPDLRIMKPDITFFGEQLPDAFHDRLEKHDRALADLVIVIGTSLKVKPVSEISSFLPADVPQIYISRDPIGHINFDIVLLGECDVIVAELARRLHWDFTHEMIPRDQQVEVCTSEEHPHEHRFRVTRPLREGADGEGDGYASDDAGNSDTKGDSS